MAYNIKKHFKNSEIFLNNLTDKPEDFWIKRGNSAALKLFHETAARVPAYKKLLKKNKVNIKQISHISDFTKLPLLDKNVYLKAYPLPDLCWDGKFSKKHWVISATSGSTGEPFYFPRGEEQDLQYALTAELYLITNFSIDKKSTLYINAFAMGVWIGGLFTYQAIKHIVDKDKYSLSIVNPGINRGEILKALKKLAPYFDQVIIGGYPPFIKDFIDFSINEHFDWKKYSIKFIFSAEGFSEEFRNYIIQKAHLKNVYTDTLNHYGTVDIGTKSYETPISILVRRIALSNKKILTELFGSTYKLPTLTQYIPEQFYFESLDGKLVCSAASGIPLVRYDLKDNGGIIGFNQMVSIFKGEGIDLLKEAKKVGVAHTVWHLPFVYVYERADFSVSFYGANVYPETIRKVLLQSKFEKYLTGKCTLEIRFSKKQDQRLYIHIEEKDNIHIPAVQKKILEKDILDCLIKENSEFRNNYTSLGRKAKPVVMVWRYEHSDYFMTGGKQKWVKK